MFDEIYITDVLERRPRKSGDAAARKDALLSLSTTMCSSPEEVLPRFVELTMQLSGGVSAGMSLFEDHPEPAFRCKYLRGSLSRFEGVAIPREDSPCAVALAEHRSVLATHPERACHWIAELKLILPEVLLVPLYVGQEQPFGTLWLVAPREGHFDRSDEEMAGELAQFVSNALQVLGRERTLKAELEEQEILAREMSHRLKNLFAMTDGMIHMTARSAESPEAMAEALSGRLRSLAAAHGLLQRRVSALGSDRTIKLHDLAEAIVAVHEREGERPPRFHIEGPDVECGDHAINGIALVVNELATNAAKYGALSVPAGKVAIDWCREADRVHLSWREEGGPLVEQPASTGFGSMLMKRTIENQLRGEMRFEWRECGLAVEIWVPLENLAR